MSYARPDPWRAPDAGDPTLGGLASTGVPAQAYRDAMSHLGGGVTVVATRDPIGRDVGITATSVTAVSLVPPLVLVCVRSGGFAADCLSVSDGWTLSMLAEDQVDLARYAARHRHPGDADDFSSWPRRRGAATGSLVLTGAVAAVECVPHAFTDAGDHTICVGRVVEVATDVTGRRPLLYVRRGYHALGPLLP